MLHSDTGERDIEAMCVKWCKVLFLAPKDWGIPLGEHLDALSKDEPQEIPLGLPFTSVASHFVQKVRETAVETIKAQEDAGILRIKQEVKTGKPVLAQQRKLSIKVESLRALNLGLSWY